MILRLTLCAVLVFVFAENVFGRLPRRRGGESISPTGGRYGRRPLPRSCSRSDDCRSRFRWFPACCRTESGGIIDPDLGGRGDVLIPDGQGRCSFRRGRPNETCNDVCGCVRGYECYRPITGACCPPKTCWTKEAAQRDRDIFNNCVPPKCFLPP